MINSKLAPFSIIVDKVTVPEKLLIAFSIVIDCENLNVSFLFVSEVSYVIVLSLEL